MHDGEWRQIALFHDQTKEVRLGQVFVKIDTNYIKKPISKDKTGKIKNYKLIAYLNLEFEIENQIKTLSLSETFKMKSYTDKFEENKREKQVKNNLTNIMLNKVTTYFANYK